MGMIKFEYKEVPFHSLSPHHGQLSIKLLNELGAQGWELVTIISGECIFKRQIKE
jgi:hypothetical protein